MYKEVHHEKKCTASLYSLIVMLSRELIPGKIYDEAIENIIESSNVNKEDFGKIAEKALNDGAIIVNPKHVSYDEVIEILEQAWG